MQWSYTIARIAGTDVKVHVTFLLLIAWVAFSAYQSYGAAAAIDTTLFLLGLFLCIVLHEFGHILMARRFGVRTPDVILLPIGGVARLERIPDHPKQEFLIAVAGPAVTLAIAVVLYLIVVLSGDRPSLRDPTTADVSFPVRLMIVNAYLLLFNLIPAFPMDGGRILRALLASRMGLVRGTRVAATLGQILAMAGGLYGISTGNPILILVAFFVFLGASAEASAVEARAAGEGLQVKEMMVTDFRTVPVHATLNQAVDLLLSGEQREFPVLDNLGRTEGILTRDNLIRGLSQRGADSTVAEAMTPQVPSVSPTLGFQEALDCLRSSKLPALPVVDPAGALVGLLTLENITDLLLVRRARG
jgi:Zn-dependent protease/predicted transcriptional regulator